MVTVVAVLLMVLAGAAPTKSAETGNLQALRTEALELVNQDRGRHGLEPLELSARLNEAAQSHAEDMLRRDYYAHVSPEGETVQDRYIQQGGSRWRLVAENIARCLGCPSPPTVERVQRLQTGWMNSPGHRKNILTEGLDSFGYGIIVGDDQTLYAVQTFAGPGMPRGLQPDEEPVALSPAEQARQMAQAINKVREREGLPPLEQSNALGEAATALLPQENGESFRLNQSVGLYEAVPGGGSRDWRTLTVVAASCGGCGTQPSAADVRSFREQWLDNPQYAETLLGEQMTHIGFVMRADGAGRKMAIAVLGRHR